MIFVKNICASCGNDEAYEKTATHYKPEKVYLVPEISSNKDDDNIQGYKLDNTGIITRGYLRRIRMTHSFIRVSESEYYLASIAGLKGEATARQLRIMNEQADDFLAADEWYEFEKTRILDLVKVLSHVHIDELADFGGHTWSKTGLSVASKTAELVAAEVI